MKQSDFHSYNSAKAAFPLFAPEKGTMIALVRDPVERFVSGFIDKCYFENRCNECGKSLSCFLIEFYEKTMRSSRNPTGSIEDNYMTRHFFPQNWQCEFSNYMGNYSVIKYSSGKGKSAFYKDLKKVLSSAKVPESKVEFVLERLKNERTRHTTHQGFLKDLTRRVYNELYSSPFLMELLIRIYYQDFVLFGFEIPDVKEISAKVQSKREQSL
ncbi:hypothetical protein FO519_009426 [Halicephalobus sp. NKZ332]|nr:hypothetical protein FO519_009426 [Halicephalobus sp. NKZ332]